MKCNNCGREFGNGDTCQYCGADKVSAMGLFRGFTSRNDPPIDVDPDSPGPSGSHIEQPLSHQICWKCQEIIPLGRFCPACGQELLRVCPKCGKEYSSQYSICPQCGTNYQKYKEEQDKKKKEEEEKKKRQNEEQKKRDKEDEEINDSLVASAIFAILGAGFVFIALLMILVVCGMDGHDAVNTAAIIGIFSGIIAGVVMFFARMVH